MQIDSTSMGIAIQLAVDAVPPASATTPEQIAEYREKLMIALAAGIAGWVSPAVSSVAEHTSMRLTFQAISWAQFAIYDSFEDDSKRVEVEPFGTPATVQNSMLTQGNQTPGESFVFTSKTYTDVTTIWTGTLTELSAGVYQDSAANWFVSELTGLILIDSAGAIFTVASNDAQSLSVAGEALYPAVGSYSLKTANPTYMVAMCSYKDSTLDGGSGFIKFEVSFDGGVTFQTVLDTSAGVDHTGGTLLIEQPGPHYVARITLTNDAEGNSPFFTDFLVATDPSPWRF